MAKALLLFDFGIQAFLLTIILVFGVFFFPLVLLIPLGGWQLSSALTKGIAWRSRLHFTYFMAASAYCLALYAFAGEQAVLPWAEDYWFSTASGRSLTAGGLTMII